MSANSLMIGNNYMHMEIYTDTQSVQFVTCPRRPVQGIFNKIDATKWLSVSTYTRSVLVGPNTSTLRIPVYSGR